MNINVARPCWLKLNCSYYVSRPAVVGVAMENVPRKCRRGGYNHIVAKMRILERRELGLERHTDLGS